MIWFWTGSLLLLIKGCRTHSGLLEHSTEGIDWVAVSCKRKRESDSGGWRKKEPHECEQTRQRATAGNAITAIRCRNGMVNHVVDTVRCTGHRRTRTVGLIPCYCCMSYLKETCQVMAVKHISAPTTTFCHF